MSRQVGTHVVLGEFRIVAEDFPAARQPGTSVTAD